MPFKARGSGNYASPCQRCVIVTCQLGYDNMAINS